MASPRRVADPAGLRPRRREPAHLDRLGQRAVLECVRRESRDARARARSSIRGSTTPRSSRSPRANGFGHVQRRRRPDHAAAAGACSSTSSRCPRRRRRAAATTARPRSAAKTCSTARRSAAVATCRRCTPSPAGTCTPARKSASTISRRSRSPDERYRTAPLRGLWTHTKGGFYHDGRFPTLGAVINHYDAHFALGLSAARRATWRNS